MTEFLVMLGVVFGGAVLFFIYVNYIKPAQLSGKSMEGKVESLLKKDLSSGYARYTFYQYHNYNKAYSQSEWVQLYNIFKETTKEMDKNSQDYAKLAAPFINAIVVDGNFYVRRGMEDMKHSGEHFVRGVNDRISLNYYVEPYEYVKDEESATKHAHKQAQAKTTVVYHDRSENRLTQAEKNEINRAEARYNRAVRNATSRPDNNFSKQEEKNAYAEYMRVLAKYAGKK